MLKMKKIVFLFGVLFCFFGNVNGQTKKVARPDFYVNSIKIECCGGGSSTMMKKKVHIIYNNAPAGMKMRVEDMSANLIGSFTLSGNDFTTPCLSLGNGISYKIIYTNSSDVPYSAIIPTTMVSPTCGIKKADTNLIRKEL
jgi:hypothetical protein